MTKQIRVPERAAARIVTAVQRQEAAQEAAREAAQTVADALGVPPGWGLGGDGEGLYFAPAPQTGEAAARESATDRVSPAVGQVGP